MGQTTETSAIAFGPQLIGRTEKALNALLDRQLAGTGLIEPQWVALTLTVGSGGAVPGETLVDRISGALKVDQATTHRLVGELAAVDLVRTTEAGVIVATEAGERRWRAVRAGIVPLTEELWGDLAETELKVASRVLNTILARADAMLATT
ncbi:hypothetical protein JQS43_08995 [Natronosporangium hydrolyticum]|uniref:Uncharacterized protein n=1 Tax=Natronosporangium hydrolyticum TaxID=2811111 RepID=A0A895YK64_9ACTN|nr:hypothetical protein [Natronosporangium hydrolyticum]QSB16395.1 hypothetical protein JQS43_08995 [Natronosporangium hydrolyticum]